VKDTARRLLAGPVKGSWRRVRRHLPPGVAEAIRVPAKRALSRAGLIGAPARSPR
jgi:hypothetical protein